MKEIKEEINVYSLSRIFTVLLTFALLLMAGQNLFAQGTRGTIRGTVTDPNQGVIANATVKLIDAQKGTEVRTSTTNENGEYQFIEIEPSTYNIVVTASNFAELRLTDVTVEPNRNLVLDAALSLTAGTNEVTVTAGAEQVDRESPTLGTTVERRRVEGLPLNGRNVLSLALLQPGVTSTGGTLSGLGLRVNGNRGTENNVTIDGANNNEVAVGGIIGGISRPDAVQEFRLLTSNFEAEFGRNTGSIINVVTRSGTSQFHGNARLFYRGTKMSAANFFDNRNPALQGQDARQPYERKEYGFNLGGPLVFPHFGEGGPALEKGNTFFFVDYERRFQKIGGSVTVTNLPTAAELSGNFSALGRPIYDPLTATAANPGGNPFPGNIIPTSRISPIAKYYLQFFPAADAKGTALVSNNTVGKVNYFTGRLDHNFNTNNLLSFTYNYTDSDTASGVAFGGTNIPGFGSTDLRTAQNYVTRFTTILKPNLVNTFLFSYAKNLQPGVAPVNTTTPAQIGFTANFVADPQYAGPPRIQFYDRGFVIGNTIQGPQSRRTQNIQFQDTISWVLGDHRLKFGGDYVKYKQNTNFTFINNGTLGYSADAEEGSNTVGDDFADFLLGNTPIATQYGAAGIRDFRQRAFAGFVQDNWRVTKNLSLSLGVRYEYNSPLTDQQDRVAYYRNKGGVTSQLLTSGALTFQGARIRAAGQAPNGVVYVGDPDPVLGGTVPRGGTQLDKNNFAPRLGFAYSLNGGSNGLFSRFLGNNETVIRGGYGWYYGAIVGDTALQQLNATGYNGTNAFYYHANGTLADPFGPDPFPLYRYLGAPDVLTGPNPNPFTSTSDVIIPSTLTSIAQAIDPLIETPEVQQYNLTFERSFAKDYVLGVSYVGNRGRKLYVSEEINPALGTYFPTSLRYEGPAITSTITSANINLRRVNNDIQQSIGQLTTKGRSKYDSLEVNFQKRISNDGLSFQLAYTLSKSMNDADTQRGGIDIVDQDAGWARSSDDHPNRFVASFIYDLPFFKNTKGFTNRLVDGWSIGGIYTYQSGDLISVGNPYDSVGSGGIISYADIGQPFTILDPKTNDLRAFNRDAFVLVDCRQRTASGALVSGGNSYSACTNEYGGIGRRGTSLRNQFRLNNYTNNWDAILSKRTRLWSESSNLELRLEAFNLFNTVRFNSVNLNLTTLPGGSPTFGTYLSADQARVIQLGARLNF